MLHQPTIGVLSPLFGGFFFGGLLSGVHQEAMRSGARVIAVQTRGEELDYLQGSYNLALAEQYVDGWIVVLDTVDHDYLRSLQQAGRPLVGLSGDLPGLACSSIRADNRGGMAAAVEHLIEHGHQRIAFVGSLDQSDIRERYEGYQQALRAHGIEPDPALFFPVDDNLERSGEAGGRAILAAGMPCTAVVAGTDLNAIGLLSAVQEAGRRVPLDLAVVGFDDAEQAQYCTPPLTSVRQRFDVLGREAARLVLDQLGGRRLEAEERSIPTLLVPRASCGCRATKRVVDTLAAEQFAEDGWRALLERRLVEQLLPAVEREAPFEPAAIWPGVTRIVDALDGALRGDDAPSIAALTEAWAECPALSTDLETLSSMMIILERAGLDRLARLPAEPAAQEARPRLDTFLGYARMDMTRAWQAAERRRRLTLDTVTLVNYRINMALVRADFASIRSLEWLRWSFVHAACLALWAAESPRQGLEISGTFSREPAELPPVGAPYDLRSFPPSELVEAALSRHPADIVTLVPVRSPAGDWGVLALVGPLESGASYGLNHLGQWTAALGSALDREALMRSLELREEALRVMNAELTAAKLGAEEASRLKSDFLAAMSHELRTPLNAIMGFAELIDQERFLAPDKQHYLQRRILTNAEHLLGLISDILDLSKIEAGRLDLTLEVAPLQPILYGVMATAVGLTKDKGIELRVDVEPNLPELSMDKLRVRQILLNLVSNAAKFTEQGSITVRAALDSAGQVVVRVEDTGIGIAPEHQQLVFEEFRQVQSDLARQYQGTGLGLPICKKLVELHGGRMWLESEPGQGSTFAFTLPLHPPEPPAETTTVVDADAVSPGEGLAT